MAIHYINFVTYIIQAQILELLWGLLTSLTVATYQIYTDNEHNVLKTVLLVGWNILRFSSFRTIENIMTLTEEGILIPVLNTMIAPTALLNKRIFVEVSSILILWPFLYGLFEYLYRYRHTKPYLIYFP